MSRARVGKGRVADKWFCIDIHSMEMGKVSTDFLKYIALTELTAKNLSLPQDGHSYARDSIASFFWFSGSRLHLFFL